jgi:hypothetical protein
VADPLRSCTQLTKHFFRHEGHEFRVDACTVLAPKIFGKLSIWLTFKGNKRVLMLDLKNLQWGARNPSLCLTFIYSTDMSLAGYDILLGQKFLEYYVSIYDDEKQRIGDYTYLIQQRMAQIIDSGFTGLAPNAKSIGNISFSRNNITSITQWDVKSDTGMPTISQ